LVMDGGTNITVFVAYSLPVVILVMHYLLEEGKPHVLELVFTTAAVIVFNRIVTYIPLPENNLNQYLNYYGGYYHMVTFRSLFRFGEVIAYIASAFLLRQLLRANESTRRLEYASARPAA
jgi:hypothetical protein